MIARDRSIVRTIKPDLSNELTYHAQNCEVGRGDMVQLMRPDGSRVEGVRYSAYGRPFTIQASVFDGNVSAPPRFSCEIAPPSLAAQADGGGTDSGQGHATPPSLRAFIAGLK